MKAKFIYEAFKKKDKDKSREDLLFPNKSILPESLNDIIFLITETLSNEINVRDFSRSENIETYVIDEKMDLSKDYDNEYGGIIWVSEQGLETKPLTYTRIKTEIEVGVEIEPYEAPTRWHPGSQGYWGLYGGIKEELKIFDGEKEILNVSKKENADIFKVINDAIEKYFMLHAIFPKNL